MIVPPRSPWSPDLIIDHWFRESRPDPSGYPDGYWICGLCGGHRGNHVQAEGAWRKPLHPFVPQRNFPSQCKPCGRQRRHTTHTPLWWDELTSPSTTSEGR